MRKRESLHTPFSQFPVQGSRRDIQESGGFGFVASGVAQHFQDMDFFGKREVESRKPVAVFGTSEGGVL